MNGEKYNFFRISLKIYRLNMNKPIKRGEISKFTLLDPDFMRRHFVCPFDA